MHKALGNVGIVCMDVNNQIAYETDNSSINDGKYDSVLILGH
jgi:hypothetical protein